MHTIVPGHNLRPEIVLPVEPAAALSLGIATSSQLSSTILSLSYPLAAAPPLYYRPPPAMSTIPTRSRGIARRRLTPTRGTPILIQETRGIADPGPTRRSHHPLPYPSYSRPPLPVYL